METQERKAGVQNTNPNPSSGQVLITDSLPECMEIEALAGFLRAMGFTVDIKYHETDQVEDECGYRSIKNACETLDQDPREGKETDRIPAILLFNTILGKEPRCVPTLLSGRDISHIMRSMRFLSENILPDLDPQNYIVENYAVDVLMKIQSGLNVAVCEKQSYKGPTPLTVKCLLLSVEEAASISIEGSKLKRFLEKLHEALQNPQSWDIPYDAFGEDFRHLISGGDFPDWFDGVFTFTDFLKHMNSSLTGDLQDRPLLRTRNAIVNTSDGPPGQHWFHVAYQLWQTHQRLYSIAKASNG